MTPYFHRYREVMNVSKQKESLKADIARIKERLDQVKSDSSQATEESCEVRTNDTKHHLAVVGQNYERWDELIEDLKQTPKLTNHNEGMKDMHSFF